MDCYLKEDGTCVLLGAADRMIGKRDERIRELEEWIRESVRELHCHTKDDMGYTRHGVVALIEDARSLLDKEE